SSNSDLNDLNQHSHSILQEDPDFTSSPIMTQFEIDSIGQKHKDLDDAMTDALSHSTEHPKSNMCTIKDFVELGLIHRLTNI
ncbi:hypothetical protein DFH28DRAFT_910402, partial [Melampsora americana]